ncbi:Nucleolar protein 14 [Frankliniella fusca]|uniref:Nucleolar protein 14 n=1 Tax=Frankliniella fusca TaxID=407009 RepID=A0AAE1H139_9NEOP|nr:Nucleolar protein 14 [Frankliniella fusca]
MVKVKKGAKKGSSDAGKKKLPPKALNPFEVHVNRQKFQVLGRKTKTDRGLPGVARAKALKKRKATLLQEYKLKDKSNKFVDRRIGERNSAMTVEDKMTARFTAERMRAQTRKAMFNLADEEVLTHRGQTLNEIEKFEDPRSDDDDDEQDNPFQAKGNLDAEFVSDAHFGGGLLSRSHEDGAKSRKDLIDQLIAESKKRKAEQQKLREQTLDLTEKLDTDWKDLLPIINSAPKAAEVEKPKPDSFDVLMRELKFEARGKPSDRLKSEDEVAKEEKEKLEELEAARLRRMQGITDSSTDSGPKHRSADDLDDGFAMDTDQDESENEESQKNEDGGSADEDVDESDNDDMNSERAEEVDDGDGENSSESEDDDIDDLRYDSSDNENTSDHEEVESTSNIAKCLSEPHSSKVQTGNRKNTAALSDKAESIREDLRKRKELMDAARKELPYTYEVPSTYEELQIVLAGRSPEYQGVIVERMIKCTHPSLANGNKEKLAHLFTLLMQHLHDAGSADANENVCWAVLDRLVPSLFDIVQWCPDDTAQCIKHVIQEKHQEYSKSRKKFPGVETLLFFKLISLLFPTSDFRHPVVTPALVFMGQMLSACRLETRQDIAKGLFLVSLFLEFTALSKRFSPESVNFLRNVLYLSTSLPDTHKVTSAGKIPVVRPLPPVKIFAVPRFSLRPNFGESSFRNYEPTDRLCASDLISKDPVDIDFCMTALLVSLRALSSMITQLSSLPACRHIFSPFPPLLESLCMEDRLPKRIKEEIQKAQKEMASVRETSLNHLVSAPKRPKPLKLYEPNIQQVYADGKQHRPISKEKQEREKLLHRYKREKKGALREIRKDRDFLAKIRIKQQLKSDAERREKVKEIFGHAAMQQGEMRKLSKGKKKK